MGAGASTRCSAHTTVIVGEVPAANASTQATTQISSLAVRRKFRPVLSKQLKVSSPKDADSQLNLLATLSACSSEGNAKRRRIDWTEDFHGRYNLGPEVMPSTNPGMRVCHAVRHSDGQRVVVKIRSKRGSFSHAQEEEDWRLNTEYMLNLPQSGGVAQMFEVLEDSYTYYVIMEKVEGMDLFEILEQTGGLPIQECKDIIRQLLCAVADLHMKGCIHKDLKLENVMVDRTPPISAKSSEVGRSRSTVSTRVPSECPTPKLKIIDFDTVAVQSLCDSTTSKAVVGTDQYIAQEAYAGKYSFASDVFAVGVIAYRVLTGRFPFKRSMFDDEAGENWVGSPKMKIIQDRLKHFSIDFSVHPFPMEPAAKEFCQQLLAVQEEDRPLATQALEHAFLTSPLEASATVVTDL